MGGETAGVLISMRPSSGVAIGWPSTLAKCHPALPRQVALPQLSLSRSR